MRSQNSAEFAFATDDVFSRIAHRYDFLCDLFSLGAHRFWKRTMAREIARAAPRSLIDVASGTGDIPMRVGRQAPATSMLVTDVCPAMLAIARQKLSHLGGSVRLDLQDAHDLKSIPESTFDAFSISFGMKICDRHRVLAEAYRILRPGGLFFCLEASKIPVGFVNHAYLAYMAWCIPMISRIVNRGDSGAHDYLLRGIHEFPGQIDFIREIESHGFEMPAYRNLTLGIVALHSARKPDGGDA